MNPVRVSRVVVGLVLIAATVSGCNSRLPLADAPDIGPTTPGQPSAPFGSSSLFGLNMTPGAVYAGQSATGTVLLTAVAPSGGLPVTLTASDSAISLPSSITVDAGRDSATFPITTQTLPADRDVVITGVGGGRSVSRTFSLWTVLPMFFSFVSDSNDPIGRGAATRFTPQSAQFRAWCHASQVTITVNATSQFFRATFAAPRGTRLTPGTYENAAPASIAPDFPATNGPEMSISGNGAGCDGTGRFTVQRIRTDDQRSRHQILGDVRAAVLGDTPGCDAGGCESDLTPDRVYGDDLPVKKKGPRRSAQSPWLCIVVG